MQPLETNGRHYKMLEAFCNDEYIMKMRERRHIFHFHYAMIVLRGKILSVGHNEYGTPSRGCGYGQHNSIHAEKNCIKNVGNLAKIRGCDMFIMKVCENGTTKERYFGNSQPCESCVVFLEKCKREYGLKNVYYTQLPERYVQEKTKPLSKKIVSTR